MDSVAIPHPYGRSGPSDAATGPVLTGIEGRRGKPDMLMVRATAVADLTDELTARKSEAIALVTGLLPLVAFVTNAAREVGPREYQAAITIAHRLRRYQVQNETSA